MIINGKEIVCLTLRKNMKTGKDVKSGEVIGLVRGMKGFIATDYDIQTREWIEEINKNTFDISPEKENAFAMISVLGLWYREERVLKELMKDN